MSWFSTNYEKAALGGAAVIALGLAFLGWMKVGSVETDFATELKGTGNNNPAVTDADKIPNAMASLKMDRTVRQAEVEGRSVNLFTGIPLFVGRNPGDKPVDPSGAGVAPIHPPIPNLWWLQYRLDPGFADSPLQDPDADGFSNREEYDSQTDPTDPAKFPSLIAKLKYARDESLLWVLRPGFPSEGGYTFKYRDSAGATNNAGAAAIVLPNTTFFTQGVQKDRFKYLGAVTRKIMNPRMNVEQDIQFARVEDQRPNKKGKIYEIQEQFPDALEVNYRNYDRTAVLRLDALGLGATEFKVEENTLFAIPPDAPKKDYLLKSVTPEAIEVEYTEPDGTKKSLQIPKG